MTNHKPSFAASPSPLKSKKQSEQEFDVGAELVGYGLQGVKVTDDELRELVEELGLDEADAGELVKGLGSGRDSEGVAETLHTEAESLETEATSEQGLVKDSKDITQDKHQ
jgi:SH3 domain-binding glutamic acid-rich protein